jgi:hydroxyethylthiazole kinase-like uncharacterized protein yjeF
MPIPKSVSTVEMRRLDRRAIERFGIPVLLLMDNAGRCVAEAARQRIRRSRNRKIVVLCGGGNNGGDGVAAARYLRGWGYSTNVLWLKNPMEWKGDLALHYDMAKRAGVRFESFMKMKHAASQRLLGEAAVLIDALLGTGTKGDIRETTRAAIAAINAAHRPVVAVDIPSGLDADSGDALGTAVRASVTVTMAAPKTGLLRRHARQFVGKLVVADIGIPL